MDSEFVTLASSAATTVVTLLATDGWEQVKTAMGSLWRRVHPDLAGAVEAELVAQRSMVIAAQDADDDQVVRALEDDWRQRLSTLLAAEPWLAAELRRLVEEDLRARETAAEGSRATPIEMHAKASGHGRVYQAGRDQHITERGDR
ncbi:hypothetical protein E6W39_21995 [Kitasatospora acidiphila]|uniref:Uncharacterized protein n=1 Tax=Kitasatospora acidiphila TaxID=2567942 RepID=A0A540W5V4_9ACTN|nr:hypothetical protein [Kitasatospora acidiphila]TQF04405.1 hypothetical protein E6W39_21995 [Kitasatospora acidiphila]